jgi:cytochrome P450
MTPITSQPIAYDPLTFSSAPDPYPVYAAMRDEAPVYHNAERGIWALSRFADVQAAARDWRTFSSAEGTDLDDFGVVLGQGVVGQGVFIDADPPSHDLLRAVLREAFTPKAINAHESHIRPRVDRLLEAIREAGSADVVEQLAFPLATGTVCRLLGLPEQDEPLLTPLLRAIEERTPGDVRIAQTARDALAALGDYLADAAQARRLRPRDDLMTRIVQGTVEGEPLSDQEVKGMATLLCVAGTETTASLVSNALLLLDELPAERARARRQEVALPGVVEEVVRCEGPLQWLARTATCDVELHGIRIPAGGRVVLVFAAANRDDRQFPDAATFDAGRSGQRNIGFGEGIHHCIGAPLARLEGRIMLERVLHHIPDYAVSGEVVRAHTHATRGLARLPIDVRP